MVGAGSIKAGNAKYLPFAGLVKARLHHWLPCISGVVTVLWAAVNECLLLLLWHMAAMCCEG
jgi:hypothetical protein